jgi:hypothetical protein
MAQIGEKTVVLKLGALLHEHYESVKLGRELIRVAICARAAKQMEYAIAAEHAAEDCIAKAVELEERLRVEL